MYVGTSGEVIVHLDDLDPTDAILKRASERDSPQMLTFRESLKCRLDAPDYSVVKIQECRYRVSPKIPGEPMLVATVTGRVPNQILESGDVRRPIEANIPVEPPLGTSFATISTFLGIMTATASLFFKQSNSANVDNSPTQKLLNDIAKKRKSGK
jgi:hypothetical protein